jgi:hypothetical protein
LVFWANPSAYFTELHIRLKPLPGETANFKINIPFTPSIRVRIKYLLSMQLRPDWFLWTKTAFAMKPAGSLTGKPEVII